MKKILSMIAVAVFLTVGLSACNDDDSDVVNHNLTKAAKNFEIQRRIVFVNGITDKYLLSIEGRCDVSPKADRVWVTCKVAKGDGSNAYKRHVLGLSDNVTYFVEQGEPADVSAYHYRVTFKPQSILPDVDFRGSTEDTPLAEKNQQ